MDEAPPWGGTWERGPALWGEGIQTEATPPQGEDPVNETPPSRGRDPDPGPRPQREDPVSEATPLGRGRGARPGSPGAGPRVVGELFKNPGVTQGADWEP